MWAALPRALRRLGVLGSKFGEEAGLDNPEPLGGSGPSCNYKRCAITDPKSGRGVVSVFSGGNGPLNAQTLTKLAVCGSGLGDEAGFASLEDRLGTLNSGFARKIEPEATRVVKVGQNFDPRT